MYVLQEITKNETGDFHFSVFYYILLSRVQSNIATVP